MNDSSVFLIEPDSALCSRTARPATARSSLSSSLHAVVSLWQEPRGQRHLYSAPDWPMLEGVGDEREMRRTNRMMTNF
jgi:hypothetical protein